MTPPELKERTTVFALRVMRLAESLPRNSSGKNISQQMVRSACSVAANYRAAQRGKSRPDFINKIAIVLEEADETEFWIELAVRAELIKPALVESLKTEAEELVRIFSAIKRKARTAV
jgi:four helix bundle protein